MELVTAGVGDVPLGWIFHDSRLSTSSRTLRLLKGKLLVANYISPCLK